MPFILIVDDHPGMAGAVAALVRSEGYEARVTYGGAEALEIIRSRPVDLMILDAMMPGMSGLEVLAALAWDGPHRHPPVVMYSGNDSGRAEAMRLGAVDFVLKVDAHKLLDVVAGHLAHASQPGARGA